MLEFKSVQLKSVPRLRKYYSKCSYRLCEYSAGVKLMWRQHWHPAFAESHGCLVIQMCIRDRSPSFAAVW